MTLDHTPPHSGDRHIGADDASRLTLTPDDQCVGNLGGAWWPRSNDLVAELPALLTALTERLGSVERVVYDPAGWAAAPGQVVAGDQTVTLDAYPYESLHKLYLYGLDGASTVLRVVPPGTDDAEARTLMADPSGEHT